MLNVTRFTRNREQTIQEITISQDERLQGLLEQPIQLTVSLQGDVIDSRAEIKGSVVTELSSYCQVCTESVLWQHQFEFELHPVEAEQLDEIDESFDPVVIHEGKLDLLDMLVNELILSLPSVITHEVTTGNDCSTKVSMSVGEKLPEKASPFAVLEQLKSSTRED